MTFRAEACRSYLNALDPRRDWRGAVRCYRKGSATEAKTSTDFIPVESPESLAANWPATGKAVLYLHDPYCPISRRARSEVAKLGGAVYLLNVSDTPELSQEVEQRTGIRHESPQVIVLDEGRPIWNASHYSITRSAIAKALADASGSGSPVE